MKRTFALLLAVGMAALFGLLSPGAAVAASDVPPDPAARTVLPAAEVGATSSPACSVEGSWGKIRYQVCFRYNCDSKNCISRGYLFLTNTATGPRTVEWVLHASNDVQGNQRVFDDQDKITLAAGQRGVQIFSDQVWHSPCGWWASEWLQVRYDSAGWSPELRAKELMRCV